MSEKHLNPTPQPDPAPSPDLVFCEKPLPDPAACAKGNRPDPAACAEESLPDPAACAGGNRTDQAGSADAQAVPATAGSAPPLEITARELLLQPGGSFLPVDMRDAASCAYGMMDGAAPIPEEELLQILEGLPLPEEEAAQPVETGRAAAPLPHSPAARLFAALHAGTPVVLCCKYGIVSRSAAQAFREKGYGSVCSLAGGYGRWALEESYRAAQDAERRDGIEKSLRKAFKHDIVGRFEKAVARYELVEEGDRIAVCISGGKDSMLMAKLFQELKRRNKFPFSLVFLCMDPGYTPENRGLIENNARLLGIPLEFFETDIFDAVYNIEKSPCYLCARMRRGYLYRFAKEHGCNKIALGHHYDDVIETILMGMLYSGQYQAMMPKLRSTNFEGMELIRPIYLVRERDIIRWRDRNGLHFIQCACKFTENCSSCAQDGTSNSKRLETKKLIAALKESNPQVESNIFRATENVVLNKVLGYKLHGERHSFLEEY